MFNLNNWPIRWKITLLASTIVLFSLSVGTIVLVGKIINIKTDDISQWSLLTARVIAQIPEVIESVDKPDGENVIQPLVEKLRAIYGSDYIVVLNMEGKRMSHPLESRVGTMFNVNEARPAFAEHIYVIPVKGDLGEGVRAYAPIINERHQQVGVVLVGNMIPKIYLILKDLRQEILIILFLTLSVGVWGSYLLASHIKNQTFKLEPQELARTLDERTAAFHAMHEGVIAIDEKERITVLNDVARKMLKIEGDVIGKSIREVIPDTRLPEILSMEHGIYNQQFYVGDTLIVSTRVPIRIKGKIAGALAIFQDKTEVTRLAEELTGVKGYIDALRAKNHEHSNKLHTIAGLIQLGKEEEALRYIFQIDQDEKNLIHFLGDRIKDVNLMGLLVGKISRAKELNIDLHLDPYSNFSRYPENMVYHDIVIILGNLIENAFDSLQEMKNIKKEVSVSIVQDDNFLTIEVEDNGKGISKEDQERIFMKGFTTKDTKDHGIGLYLVSSIVSRSGGEIEVDSDLGYGTRITIRIPMERKED